MQSLSEQECNQLEATSIAVKQHRRGVAKLEHWHCSIAVLAACHTLSSDKVAVCV